MAASPILQRMRSAHRAEVFGEALYAKAAKVSPSPFRRTKWAALAELETQTRSRLARELLSLGLRPGKSPLSRAAGRALGFIAGLAPWTLVLRVLLRVARATTRRFETWEREAPSDRRHIFREITAHERAQCRFAESELAGDTENSMRCIVELLGESDPKRD